MTVACVAVVIVAEAVKLPPDVTVPALAGPTVHTTVCGGLFVPATDAEKGILFPAVTVPVDGVTVTEVTVGGAGVTTTVTCTWGAA